MIVIPIRICGDIWVNPEEVSTELYSAPITEYVELDFRAEGPSALALGVIDLLDQHCAETGRNPSTILLKNNPNNTEITRYRNPTPGRSHFFKMSQSYWSDVIPELESAKTFGFFMGRRTGARARILYDLWHNYSAVLSLMRTVEIDPWIKPSLVYTLEPMDTWVIDDIKNWFACCPVPSIDGHTVRDQYVENPQTNIDILNYYNQFQVEIVAETYTLGNTFFPTEKTVRPIMAAKPYIVYGPKHFLANLRKQGFETYSNCWDESYDQLEGIERWSAIKQILPTVKVDDVTRAIAHRNRLHLKKIL